MPKVTVRDNKIVEPIGRLAEQQAKEAEKAVALMNEEVQPEDSPRKLAPAIELVNDLYRDEREQIVAIEQQKLFKKGGKEEVKKWHFCFRRSLEKEPLHIKEMMGYTIVKNEKNKPITHKLDVLCVIPREKYQHEKDKAGMLARIQLEEAEAGARADWGSTDREGRKHGLVKME